MNKRLNSRNPNMPRIVKVRITKAGWNGEAQWLGRSGEILLTTTGHGAHGPPCSMFGSSVKGSVDGLTWNGGYQVDFSIDGESMTLPAEVI